MKGCEESILGMRIREAHVAKLIRHAPKNGMRPRALSGVIKSF